MNAEQRTGPATRATKEWTRVAGTRMQSPQHVRSCVCHGVTGCSCSPVLLRPSSSNPLTTVQPAPLAFQPSSSKGTPACRSAVCAIRLLLDALLSQHYRIHAAMADQDRTRPNAAAPLLPPATTSTSTSSFMSRFYTPMNPGVTPLPRPASPPPPPSSQTPLYQQLPISASGSQGVNVTPAQTLGANAASLLANMAASPGYLSDTAIQEARQEYARNQHGHQQPLGQTSHAYYDPAAAGAATAVTPSIEALLKELKQAGDPAISSSSTYSSSLAVPPYTAPSPSTSITALPVAEDYSNGKITPQLLKKLAAIAEADAQEGGTLLGEIKRLQERQVPSPLEIMACNMILWLYMKREGANIPPLHTFRSKSRNHFLKIVRPCLRNTRRL